MDFARAEYNDMNDTFRFGTDDSEECSRRLIKLLADNNAAAESLKIGTASLEEVFRKVVGG